MKRIQLDIKALSPLAIGRQKPGGSISEADNYISGTVIRGAIAAQILHQSPQTTKDLTREATGGDFQRLFLSDNPAIFRNAYPANVNINGKTVSKDGIQAIKVLPSTALSSKNKPGFCRKRNYQGKEKGTGKGNGVFDTLIDRFCADSHQHPFDPNCPIDYDRVDVFSGFYTILDTEYYSVEADKRLLTRVGINRRRATAEEQVLYSVEILNESQDQLNESEYQKPVYYRGEILVPENLANAFCNYIRNNETNFRLGGSASRGLGKVKIEVKAPQDIQENIQQRIAAFKQVLEKRWQDWGIFGKPARTDIGDRTFFTLDLQSDAILTEDWRRTTVISSEMLKSFTNVDADLELEVAYSSYDYRSGWNSAWGLMKDVELVTNKGAVYLFSTTQPDKWYDALAKLEINGVGDRTCEGFGQVEICNEFHHVFREAAV